MTGYRKRLPFLVAISIHFAALCILFFTRVITDFFFLGYVSSNFDGFYRRFGLSAAEGLLPYKDVFIEYPPLSALWFWLLSPFTKNPATYSQAQGAGMVVISFFGLFAVIRLARLITPDAPRERTIVFAGILYTAATIAAGPAALISTDYIAMSLTAWAVVFLCQRQHTPAAALLAAGFAAKGYPIVLAPLFLFESYRTGGKYSLLKSVFGFLLVSAVFYGIPFTAAPGGMLDALRIHALRGTEKATIYGAVMFLLSHAGIDVPLMKGHLGWPPGAGALPDFFLSASPYILLSLVAIPYASLVLGYNRKNKMRPPGITMGTSMIVVVSCAILSAALLGFKAGSPQLLAWLVPVVPCVVLLPHGVYAYLAFLAAGVASQWLFPWHYQAYTHTFSSATTAAICIKALMLSAVFAITTAMIGKQPIPRNDGT